MYCPPNWQKQIYLCTFVRVWQVATAASNINDAPAVLWPQRPGGYTCLSSAAFIIQSVFISLIAAAAEEQAGKLLKYDGCADECVWD